VSFDSPALLVVLAVVVTVSLGIRTAVSFERRGVQSRTTRLLDELGRRAPAERGIDR
jgi:hypothetical protein